MPWFALPQATTVTQSDKGLAKIAEGASPRRYAETSPVKVKDTHLMNNKLPPAEIFSGDCSAVESLCGKCKLDNILTAMDMGHGRVVIRCSTK